MNTIALIAVEPPMRLAARKRDAAVLHAGLGLGGIAPVESRSEQRYPFARCRDCRIVVVGPPASSSNTRTDSSALRPVRQNTAGRPGADDDVIEFPRVPGLGS